MLYIIFVASLLAGGFCEFFFYSVERLCINIYARSGGSRVNLMRLPITVSYYLKFPIIVTAIVYVSQFLMVTYPLKYMFLFYCLFAIGMYVISEYEKGLD